MLILSRKKCQELVLQTVSGDVIRVRIVEIDPKGRVRLGIDAPRDTIIDRAEVYERRTGQTLKPLTLGA